MKAVIAHSIDIDSDDAVAEIIDSARRDLGDAEPRLALLFTGIDHDSNLIIRHIREMWPSMSLVGCSTDGELSTPEGFQEDSVACVFLAGDDFSFVTGVADRVSEDPEGRVADAVKSAVSELGARPEMCITMPTSLTASATSVVSGFRSALGNEVPVFGATAGDQWRFEQTSQFHGDEILHDGVPFVVFGEGIRYSFAFRAGWDPIGEEGTVTDADGMLVKEINGEPATAFYRSYLGDVDLTHLAEYPLAVMTGVPDQYYLRASMKTFEDSGWLQFAGEVPKGARVKITHTTRDGVVAATTAALDVALQRFSATSASQVEPALALCFVCAGRKQVLGMRTGEEAEAVRARLGSVPALGFYGYGEICPGDVGEPTLFHNETFTTLLLGERRA